MSSKWRKHVTQAADHAAAPTEGQQIVRALGSRGSNLIEVQLPDGSQTLCLLPSKFNKKLWVKRGGYLVIERDGGVDAGESVSGVIVRVLYDEDVRHLKSQLGVWPQEFASNAAASKGGVEDLSSLAAALPIATSDTARNHKEGAESAADQPAEVTAAATDGIGRHGLVEEGSSSSDDDLPPLEPNTNRPTREYEYTDDETTDEE